MTTWEQFKQKAAAIAKKRNFPLGVLLGQAALETGRGASPLSQNKNNWFGMGAADGKEDQAFGFQTADDSINNYINWVQQHVLSKSPDLVNSPTNLIQAIQNAGYASDPQYVQKVMSTPEFAGQTKGFQMPVMNLPKIGDIIPKAYAETPTAPSPSGPTMPSGNTHTVKSGDSLWSIAQQYLGDGSKWQQLQGYSGDPHKLPSGTKITIPTMPIKKPVAQPDFQSQQQAPSAQMVPPAPIHVKTNQPHPILGGLAGSGTGAY